MIQQHITILPIFMAKDKQLRFPARGAHVGLHLQRPAIIAITNLGLSEKLEENPSHCLIIIFPVESCQLGVYTPFSDKPNL